MTALCTDLRKFGISYCHWKSNDALHLSASGENDLDLLVDRHDLTGFLGVLAANGFKEARPKRRWQIPGVVHYYGLDRQTGRWVHVDAQAQLRVGDDMTKNVRLPMEEAYLASCTQGPLFRVPAVEYELAVLVVRLALKHATWDSVLFGLAGLRAGERRELEHLWSRADAGRLRSVVEDHLPGVGWPAWARYAEALLNEDPLGRQVLAGRPVLAGLTSCMGRAPVRDAALRSLRRLAAGWRHVVLRRRTRKQLVHGGALVAVVGGDGAGKSTAVSGIASWLGTSFAVRTAHLGKPPRSLLTLLVKGALAVARGTRQVRSPWPEHYPTTAGPPGLQQLQQLPRLPQLPGVPWLLWQLMTARDRRLELRRAARWAAGGDIVVCDRFPLAQLRLMDGSRTGWIPLSALSRIARRLVLEERRCYSGLVAPDLLVVLRVDPDTAVARKSGVDPAAFVRPRSAEVFDADWAAAGAVVVDASRPSSQVLAELRSLVWDRV